ncbi:uncharacterized protein LOC130724724 [Lotus japonicus]|uniref:uncharacterized protein LOC130724724 n=1 Tax=Lotus japonicus TaxID=34305 RepID=UPI0025911BAC|nr:uncharacterized protein LOC130724724 [Lotus japonicus]
MAFLVRLRTIHTVTNPSRSVSMLHHQRLLSTSSSGAGDLLRLRTFHSLTTPSLLHHHRLLSNSTSNSGDSDDSNTNHPFLSSLTKIQTFLLRRLIPISDTGVGDHPSPSLVKEIREAFKQLAESDVFLEPFISTLPFELPSPLSQPTTPPSPTTLPPTAKNLTTKTRRRASPPTPTQPTPWFTSLSTLRPVR